MNPTERIASCEEKAMEIVEDRQHGFRTVRHTRVVLWSSLERYTVRERHCLSKHLLLPFSPPLWEAGRANVTSSSWQRHPRLRGVKLLSPRPVAHFKNGTAQIWAFVSPYGSLSTTQHAPCSATGLCCHSSWLCYFGGNYSYSVRNYILMGF